MKAVYCVVVAVIWGLTLLPQCMSKDCKKTGPCSCETTNGTIDLSPLDGHGTPKFKDQAATNPSDTWTYSWNPCSPFTEDQCSNVAGCQVAQGHSSSNAIGTQDTAAFIADPSTDNILLQYTSSDPSTTTTRTLIVILICDPNVDTQLTVAGEGPSLTYMMSLQSKYCCPRTLQGAGGLSAGSILLIIFFTVLLVYIVGGVVFTIFVRKASGKEVIPNYSFWSALPGLIKDGTLFTFRRLCSLCGRRGGYDKI